jgi:hypothetical protein
MKGNRIKNLIYTLCLCTFVSVIGGCASTDARLFGDLLGTATELAGNAYLMKQQYDYQDKALKQQKKYMEKFFEANKFNFRY